MACCGTSARCECRSLPQSRKLCACKRVKRGYASMGQRTPGFAEWSVLCAGRLTGKHRLNRSATCHREDCQWLPRRGMGFGITGMNATIRRTRHELPPEFRSPLIGNPTGSWAGYYADLFTIRYEPAGCRGTISNRTRFELLTVRHRLLAFRLPVSRLAYFGHKLTGLCRRTIWGTAENEVLVPLISG